MSLLSQIGSIGSSVGGVLGIGSQVGQLFFPREYKIGDVKIDTVISETHTSTADITKYPVEAGVVISDHVTLQPYSVTVNGVVSDVAGNEFGDFAMVGLAGKAFDVVGGLFGKGEEKNDESSSNTRSQEVWRQLQNVQTSGQTMTYYSQLRDYSNMVITSLVCTQDKDTKMVVSFSATLTQVTKVNFMSVKTEGLTKVKNAETITAKDNKPTDDRASSPIDSGKKNGSNGSLAYETFFGD